MAEHDLAELLREARESLSLSQEEAAGQAGVPLAYLKVLEGEGSRHGVVPDESYLIPYLKRYAVLLNLDQGYVIPLLLSETEKPHVRRPPQLVSRARSKRRLWTGIAAVAVVIAVAFLVSRRIKHNPTGGILAAGATPTPEPVPGARGGTRGPKATGESLSTSEPKLAYTLKIAARKQSWVSVAVDGGVAETVILQPGEERIWQANDHFLLSVGNAGAVGLSLNGVEQPPLGKEGEVVRELRFPPS